MSAAEPSALPDADSADFRRCMRAVPGTVAVITTGETGARTGLTATAVCSLSDSPPMLLVCVNGNASAHPVIQRTGRFVVNILADSHLDLAGRFAGRDGVDGEGRFADGPWLQSESGASVLTTAIATFDCVLEAEHRYGSHSVFVGRVKAVASKTGQSPLIYLDGRFGSFAESPAAS
jgi:flavin reductase